jgi:UDP-glucose 4-epimerase
MKKAVVTGGVGFIVSHLTKELTQRDYSLTIFDDLSADKKGNIVLILKKATSNSSRETSTTCRYCESFLKALIIFSPRRHRQHPAQHLR